MSYPTHSQYEMAAVQPPSPYSAKGPHESDQATMAPHASHTHLAPDYPVHEHKGGDSGPPTRPDNSRTTSFDPLMRQDAHAPHDRFNPRGDMMFFETAAAEKNMVVRIYQYLISVSVVTRWLLFIVPILGLLWLPGIFGLTFAKHTTVWGVKLIWWSIWLTVIWAGWWAALATARLLPRVLNQTVGVIAIGSRVYIDWFTALPRYVALLGWSIAVFATFPILIKDPPTDPNNGSDSSSLDIIGKISFGVVLCSALLLGEKIAIQWIAVGFHERSYAERIEDQKKAMRVLVTLYQHSSDIAGRTDTLRNPNDPAQRQTANARRMLKQALKGVRTVAQSTTTVLGNVASEIAGSSVLQPTSPEAMVHEALQSANKTRLLARRLFYSFKQPKAEALYETDIARFFPDQDSADAAFALFDKDANGDASREEVELACMEAHREQLSIANSMRDLDSAVGRLDNILMSLYWVIAAVIMAVTIETKLTALLTGLGTIVLGLSWLIGGSLQEVLSSIIFLFVKHPYDVGDRVDIDPDSFTVKEIRLLSTVFIDVVKGCQVQIPHSLLTTKAITNIRRSPPMAEKITLDVAYGTTFEQLESLRTRMLAFVKDNRRDYIGQFDVSISDIPEQSKMTLVTAIKYKSNFQQGALRTQRKNKWICALKEVLAEVKIFGPSGNPSAPPAVQHVTLVPFEAPEEDEHAGHPSHGGSVTEPVVPKVDYKLADRNAAIIDDSQDVFGEREQLQMTNPRPTLPRPRVVAQPDAATMQPVAGPVTQAATGAIMPMPIPMPTGHGADDLELGLPDTQHHI